MKRKSWIGIGLMVLIMSGLTTREVTAQILNSGFETAGATISNAANWTVNQAVGGPVYAVRTNDNPHAGSFNFFVHLASTGAGPVVEFNQSNIPIIGGANYSLSFYASRLTGSAGDNDQYNIQWLNTNSAVVGSTGYIGFTPGPNIYAQTLVNNIAAPATAAKANLFFHFAGAAIPSQSANINIDDVSLTTTNTGGGGGGGGVTNQVQAGISRAAAISWFASNNVPYQVQWSSDQISWNNLGGMTTGTGSSNSVIDAAGPPHNFYRVLSIQ